MIRRFVIASVVLLVATIVKAAPPSPPPDFWYVVPDAANAAGGNRVVQGIVIPSKVEPTVETSPGGAVVSWQRPDGTRQSLVVQGISSFTFRPGPLKGTTFVPFATKKAMAWVPDTCCTCASWNNMEESVTELTCVIGCSGCGCEACICTHEEPCPHAAVAGMTLVAHNDPSAIMTIGRSGAVKEVAIAARKGEGVRLRGKRLATEVNANGEVEIDNPDSIAIPGRVTSSTSVRGDRAIYAWSSPEVAVIAEQPLSLSPPSFRNGMIDLKTPRGSAPASSARPIALTPAPDRCWICGHHPNSEPDFDKMECVIGTGSCMRCISFECFAGPES